MTENLKVPGDVAVVGLGYVGLPLALAFARELPTTGFDIDVSRVDELVGGSDRNHEVPEAEILSSSLTLTSDASCIGDAEFIVVTVPTPLTEDHKPDLSLLESASATIGRQLRGRSDGLPVPIIVYESTTYPGCTEDFCGPIIERESGLRTGEGFFLGYSPERTNFGDPEHTLETVIKVVSGQTPAVAKVVSDTYGLIAKAGTHLAPNIKTAEASKVIENVQRDLNIALFNELAMIFDRMDIRSSEVFDAAATKWNFHRYQPGLVGGHCIPVDPYYLTYAAAKVGYDAEVVLAGRAVNEIMPEFIATRLVKLLDARITTDAPFRVLVIGLAFKRDVRDIRNSKVVDLARALVKRGLDVEVYDPLLSRSSLASLNMKIAADALSASEKYDAVILATPHKELLKQQKQILDAVSPAGVFFDLSGVIDRELFNSADVLYWSLLSD